MDLSLYRETPLESWIYELFKANGIYSASDIDIDLIASLFEVDLEYYEHRPFSCNITNVIFLNKYEEDKKQRDVFFHELCHVLRHAGDQRRMHALFKQHQELEAGWFQMYAAIPFFMIQQLELPQTQNEAIHVIAEEFKVSYDFARKRLNQIQRRVLERQYWGAVREEEIRIRNQVMDYQLSLGW